MIIQKSDRCADVVWAEPVMIQLRQGEPEKISGPLQALNCLAQRWPEAEGEQYWKAKKLCMAALGERIPCAGVRDAFVAAAAEAHMLVTRN
ncbi:MULTISPECIES: DUF982 domain-containing protein [unclassified Rhizobium]|uniref:DUF982 domain-containing protein n=1 Tax=unclassified Rhizobium TaxID=2613769 RepID=UPI00071244F0|nr:MULTISPECIES: DUF982 domain-containing protein [unclassified Rhizobium]KQS90865.1 hypothetical protein ASG42_10170 [Rhizobium sp. Leaf391]KQS95953.1 hypothetical protein ASG50_02390 [Rhizobium sp. Leaf386]KQU09972.1 hypothetical protein ASG68_02980 [Rhizobium sp. Leaf453]